MNDIIDKLRLKLYRMFLRPMHGVYYINGAQTLPPPLEAERESELLEKIKNKGIEVLDITLHVGLGTFKPVKEENVEDHVMHSEYYSMSEYTANRLNLAKKEGRRVIAIGTTSTRTLETIITKYGEFRECSGQTDIFIYPPYEFRSIDCQITNFHLPKSTLIMMIAAQCSKEMILHTYQVAIEEKYRFFSFGDSMFIDNE